MESILHVQDVRKNYLRKEVLRGVSFDIYPGQITGLVGPNGSGKTTLLKLINTLITDYEGEILICGAPPGVESKKHISFLPDNNHLKSNLRIRTVLDFHKSFFEDFNREKAIEMIKAVGLDSNEYIKNLSKGMQEKLLLVITMSRQADLFIFDEPIAAVDPAAREFILTTIIKNYSENAAILFSTHLISDAESILSKVLFLRDGQISIDEDADDLREQRGLSIDQIFREEFRC